MSARRLSWPRLLPLLLCPAALLAAPDEDLLGKARGYPAGRNLAEAYQAPYMVGSFSAMDSLAPSCAMAPSDRPLPLEEGAAAEPPFAYRFDGRALLLDDYMRRQRVTALLVLKDGGIVAERYNYGRAADMRFLSNSMAKTVVAMALLKARAEGLVRSFDETAATYAPELTGTLYGETRIVNLLRMASGARFVEDYSRADDRSRFNAAARTGGFAAAARAVTERADAEGRRFNYASAQTAMLGLVLRGATGRTLCDYAAEKIWRPIGAEAPATWLLNPADRVEIAAGGLNATARDYARLGWMMANDGMGPSGEVLSRDDLLDMTDPARQPEAFRPGALKGTQRGYGLQTWLLPGGQHRFALLGVHGQAIFVDPRLKLVVVHLAVGQDASGDASGHHLGAEREALWRGILAHYGGQ